MSIHSDTTKHGIRLDKTRLVDDNVLLPSYNIKGISYWNKKNENNFKSNNSKNTESGLYKKMAGCKV